MVSARTQSPHIRVLLAAAAFVVYALSFASLYRNLGPGVEAIGALPVMLTAAMFGMSWGVGAAVLTIGLHIVLYSAVLGGGWWAFADHASLTSNLMLPLVGLVLGRFRDLQTRLDDEVRERARTETELRQARDDARQMTLNAEAASRAKSDFLARMSHEIRTPMHGVIGMAQLLFETDMDAVQSEYLEMIRSSANAQLLIINDILDFSKVEAGKLDLEETDFDLVALVEESSNLLMMEAAKKGVDLVFLKPPDIPDRVIGDPGRLRQILLNLLSNSIKFTSDGSVEIEIKVLSRDEQRVQLRFEVRDTGIGMSAEQAALIFEPFKQADTSTTRKFGGTGLGLTICRQLVDLMQGTIGCDSEPGKGSSFWFEIETAVAESLPTEEIDLAALPQLQGVRALVMTDIEGHDDSLIHRLASLGMEVEIAHGEAAALTNLAAAAKRNKPFALVVVDLPTANDQALGFGAAVRDDPLHTGVVLTLLTADSTALNERGVADAGYAVYLTHPLTIEVLHDALTTVVGRTESGSGHRVGTPKNKVMMVTIHRLQEERSRSRQTVLLAEDNRVNQVIAVKLLERLGLRVDIVQNGAEAVNAFSTKPYDAIFMDGLMPVMDGYTAATEIRKLEAPGKRIPILAMTASAMAGDRERCLEAGMDEYLTKPIDGNALQKAVGKWLPTRTRHMSAGFKMTRSPAGLPIDVDVLRNLKQAGGPEVVGIALDLFMEASVEAIAELRLVAKLGDPEALRNAAHKFKGSCGSVGARQATLVLQRLEHPQPGDDTDMLIKELEAEVQRAERTLRSYRKSGSAAFNLTGDFGARQIGS
jgi:signal transduction histidine kinase/CheY-like chemotaxis protein/HPt (histidine-containing phosphotransfer) domain-containing protein